MTAPRRPDRFVAVLALLLLGVAVWSVVRPYELGTWVAETFPAWIGAALLAATYRRFPFTPVTYLLVAIFAAVLLVGGHYTYARVPLGNWVRDLAGLERNHFDRMGHFLQGVVPALLARELLLRKTPLRPGGWLFTLVGSVALAVSACYEIFEWWFAVAFGGAQAVDFLGAQGDVWDAQWDMFLALSGAVLAQLLLARLQDRQLVRMGEFQAAPSQPADA